MDNTLQQFPDLVQVGDTVLSAARDPLSKVIRIGSRSRYSHGAMITGPDQMTEAYDHALTPTVGMVCLALCGLSGPVLKSFPPRLRRRATLHQLRLATDGIRRMHCAETLTRIYLAAGVPLRFRSNRLAHHIGQLDEMGPASKPADLPTTPRIAQPGCWPVGGDARRPGEQVRYAVRTFRKTWQERARSRDPIDMADLVLPGDFVDAEPLEPVAHFVRTGDGWQRLAA